MRTFILICWLIFVAFWVANASWSKPNAERQSRRSRFWYLSLLTLGVVLLINAFASGPLSLPLWPRDAAISGLAGLLCLSGLLTAIWARWTIGSNWSSTVTFKHDHELVTRGPYRFVRHPIYTGMLMMLLGSALGLGRLDGFLGFAVCCMSFSIKLRKEEALMMQHFPADYPAYRARVKAIVPFVL